MSEPVFFQLQTKHQLLIPSPPMQVQGIKIKQKKTACAEEKKNKKEFFKLFMNEKKGMLQKKIKNVAHTSVLIYKIKATMLGVKT